MTDIKAALPDPKEFDYRAAIRIVSGDVFQLLGKNAYPLIEWCVNDALTARHEGSLDRLSKRLGFLSIMASYFGASPIEKMSHQIDVLLTNGNYQVVDDQLSNLQSEVERFLPVLRERLSAAGLHG